MCSNAHRKCERYSLLLKQNKKANAYEKYMKIICISTLFPAIEAPHPYASARRFLRSLRFSIERGANIVFLPINPMILVI